MSRSVYEIRAVGDAPSELLDDFEGATVSIDPGGFTIHVALGAPIEHLDRQDLSQHRRFDESTIGFVRGRAYALCHRA